MYAVKANPSPDLLRLLWDSGITHYDVASIAEVRLVASTLPEAAICFMHPVKAEEAIARGLFQARRPHLQPRFARRAGEDRPRATKGGGRPDAVRAAARVVRSFEAQPRREVRRRPRRGQGAADRGAPGGRRARHLLPRRQPGDVARRRTQTRWSACAPRSSRRRVTVDVIDVGGGFPVHLSGHGAAAARALFRNDPPRVREPAGQSYSAELWCEPGRALCAEYSSLVVRVEKRRGDELFINDGAYGALFDAAHIGWRFPVAAAARARQPTPRDMAFSFYGPTCDDIDHMAGPFLLPGRRRRGRLYRDRHARRLWLRDADRVQRLRHRTMTVVVSDEPMASALRRPSPNASCPANVVKL